MGMQVISFRCVLKNKMGQVLGSTVNHDVLSGATHQSDMLMGLARGLQDLMRGEKRHIELSAKEAYGFYDPRKVFVHRREELDGGDALKIGDQFMLEASTRIRGMVRVIEASDDALTLDGNHPLAGQDLIFEIETIAVREATAEEIEDSRPPAPLQALH